MRNRGCTGSVRSGTLGVRFGGRYLRTETRLRGALSPCVRRVRRLLPLWRAGFEVRSLGAPSPAVRRACLKGGRDERQHNLGGTGVPARRVVGG